MMTKTQNKKILVADDEEEFVAVLSERLQQCGFDVSCAYDGAATIEKARAILPDLILLDWRMPYGKGSAVLEMLAEKEETKNIPVVVISGIDETGMDEEMQRFKVKARLYKPYQDKQLLDVIKECLGD
ncbi:MAG: hypothetical protein A3G32_05820 [Deltaproteobacteria bacterium RIFCSPLOWO2_12_FULL_40_28]|nr:MAG: hypothetical protein A3C45_03990 [Deltaproteobacteria bacterium RIFCSPHIGHO2_02_FULL_40_28]OGQ18981.1 MAG: hypothetical protein A3E27_09820 [Deltaproteobacteria bacterium RIFCSPHIGHO2_12_FULL_40_32]OGQ39524.1 MAG: hypothetical protein A3I69_09935 [Deltaproteobacteria bacterium RIFCSPLOWO2_02_FULL_40_36]OGQ53414.1 MAG: hypothetical protein A3G32_05820 [Deltaproteobacteria bacterium RIFCSPLOWO2_12_FULL_40_28]